MKLTYNSSSEVGSKSRILVVLSLFISEENNYMKYSKYSIHGTEIHI